MKTLICLAAVCLIGTLISTCSAETIEVTLYVGYEKEVDQHGSRATYRADENMKLGDLVRQYWVKGLKSSPDYPLRVVKNFAQDYDMNKTLKENKIKDKDVLRVKYWTRGDDIKGGIAKALMFGIDTSS